MSFNQFSSYYSSLCCQAALTLHVNDGVIDVVAFLLQNFIALMIVFLRPLFVGNHLGGYISDSSDERTSIRRLTFR